MQYILKNNLWMDFAKALHTVPHGQLLEDTEIRGTYFNPFKSYLSDRLQYIKI